jgi:hypothetical protein
MGIHHEADDQGWTEIKSQKDKNSIKSNHMNLQPKKGKG